MTTAGKVMSERVCIICGSIFTSNYSHQLCCSKLCTKARRKEVKKAGNKRAKERQAVRRRTFWEQHPRNCKICKAIFIPIHRDNIICSDACRKENVRKYFSTEYRKKYKKVYRPINKERLQAYNKRWNKLNPEKVKEMRRRARRKQKIRQRAALQIVKLLNIPLGEKIL
jgi:hypothetical protein